MIIVTASILNLCKESRKQSDFFFAAWLQLGLTPQGEKRLTMRQERNFGAAEERQVANDEHLHT